MNKLLFLLFFLSFSLLQGCTTYILDSYSVDGANIVDLRQFNEKKFRVGLFTSSELIPKAQRCGVFGDASIVHDFDDYIRSALISEMLIAQVFDKESDIEITGFLKELKQDSTDGIWFTSIEIRSSNGLSILVSDTYNFEGTMKGGDACRRTVKNFVPAAQDLISEIINHPRFESLLSSGAI